MNNKITLVKNAVGGLGFILDIYKGHKLFKSIPFSNYSDMINSEAAIKTLLGIK